MFRDDTRHVCPSSEWPAAILRKWTPAALNRDRLTGLLIRKHCPLQWLKHIGTPVIAHINPQVLDT